MATKRKFNLNERAMLAVLKLHRWYGTCVDAVATNEVAENHGAHGDAGKYYKALVPKNALKGIRSAENLIRSEHLAMTLPWADDGARILSQFAYSTYVERMNRAKAVYANELSTFVNLYPGYKESAKTRLNSLYNADEYPTESAIRKMFYVEVKIRPIESAQDFRIDLGEDTASIRKAIEVEVQTAYDDGIKGVWKGLHASITKAVERLKEYSASAADGEERKGFRSTLITNIIEQLDLIPFLNIMEDPTLNKFAEQIRKELCKHDADALKENDTVRDQVVASADAILEKMSAFIA